jgi:tRNA pseudouridine38-40 synthase
MKKGAKKLLGTKDFSTFRASSCNAKSPIKTMKSVLINQMVEELKYNLNHNHFYNNKYDQW